MSYGTITPGIIWFLVHFSDLFKVSRMANLYWKHHWVHDWQGRLLASNGEAKYFSYKRIIRISIKETKYEISFLPVLYAMYAIKWKSSLSKWKLNSLRNILWKNEDLWTSGLCWFLLCNYLQTSWYDSILLCVKGKNINHQRYKIFPKKYTKLIPVVGLKCFLEMAVVMAKGRKLIEKLSFQ